MADLWDQLESQASQPPSKDNSSDGNFWDQLASGKFSATQTPIAPVAKSSPKPELSASGLVNAGWVAGIHAIGGGLNSAGWALEHGAQAGQDPSQGAFNLPAKAVEYAGKGLQKAGQWFSNDQYSPQGAQSAAAVGNFLSPVTEPIGKVFSAIDQKQRELLGDEKAQAAETIEGMVGPGIVAKTGGALVRNIFGSRGAERAAATAKKFGELAPEDTQSISAAAADGGAIPKGAPEPLGPPIEGGLPDKAQNARKDILQRVGISNARKSAVQGDAMSAATDYQMSKYDQPAGRAAAANFENEKNALAAHTEGLIENAGGTVGMDEDALANRGAAIARPFNGLKNWFDSRIKQLYNAADERSAAGAGTSYTPGVGTSLTNLDSVDQLLKDPSFQNTLMAKDQGGLLGAVQKQLALFRQNNPNGFSAKTAEQFRQWLNQVRTPANKWAIGQLTNTVDNDVTSAAGENIYGQARALNTLKMNTLDKIDDLLDTSEPSRLPDQITRLDPKDFQSVMQMLREMPDDLQPDAQAAVGEIKGHLLNKVLQAGTQTSRGVASNLWGTDRVENVLKNNAAKLRLAFIGDPVTQQGLEDIASAGQILRVNPSYPGADAQAANAMKRGLVSRFLPHGAGMGGAAVGGWALGPLGAAGGGAAAEGAGLSIAQKLQEKAALKAWEKRIMQLNTPKQ